MTALNAMITLGFSIPFVFTTAGWLAMVFQVVTGAAIFICILLVKACFDNPEVLLMRCTVTESCPDCDYWIFEYCVLD